jgi:hypothetical protein
MSRTVREIFFPFSGIRPPAFNCIAKHENHQKKENRKESVNKLLQTSELR